MGPDEVWDDGWFKYKCGPYGKTEFLGCIFEGVFIPVGKTGEKFGTHSSCTFIDGEAHLDPV
ncbi:hypothetical protein GCK32_019563 [Trichostrongylus colubriformis]|uniref:Uncharacterized protein n=1 Tax=Trichostrongylus colubriformis TaxID=6319 RepID=A0AAN8FQ38_TRICO